MLAHAAEQAIERRYEDFCIVDVDCHHYETEAFNEILQYMEDPVMRHEAKYQGTARGGIASADGSYQEIGGRITRYPGRRIEKVPPTPHRDITLMRRWMDAMGVDIACMFPTPMLNLAACPRVEVEVAMAQAYNRWLCDKILGEEPRFKSMLYLPFNDPEACYKTVLEFADRKGVIGFMVTATHYRGVYDNAYAKTYAALQERNLPLAFHAAFNWADSGLSMTNRFIAVHALGFAWHNMLHLTNWVVNGMPERFPRLKTIWIESGLAWIPFLMQRLDNEYMMRTSDCALLKKKPSDYMRDMYFTSQPMEMVDNREALRAHLQDDQRRDAAALLLGLSALGHGPAEHDLRPAVPERAGQAQHPGRQCPPAVQSRAGAVGDQAAAQGGAHAAAAGNQQGVRRRQRGGVSETLSRLMLRDAPFGRSSA